MIFIRSRFAANFFGEYRDCKVSRKRLVHSEDAETFYRALAGNNTGIILNIACKSGDVNDPNASKNRGRFLAAAVRLLSARHPHNGSSRNSDVGHNKTSEQLSRAFLARSEYSR
jgi:hypothetical protein